MTDSSEPLPTRLAWCTRLGCWLCAIGGLILPWAIMLAVDRWVRGLPWEQARRSFQLHLFAPGYNLFLVGILTAVPFALLALAILLHLGLTPGDRLRLARRRAIGLAAAGVTMILFAGWTHWQVLTHPDAQGALAYFVLPPTLLILALLGYLGGRGLALVLPISRAR